MPYSIQSRWKTDHMTIEEQEVYDALYSVCVFDQWRTDPVDFVSTSALFRAYLQWRVNKGLGPAGALNQTQFGVALRRAYGLDDSRKCRRMYHGRKEMGYCHVRGKLSVRTNEKPGNPNWKRKEDDAVLQPT